MYIYNNDYLNNNLFSLGLCRFVNMLFLVVYYYSIYNFIINIFILDKIYTYLY
jgi:hypothetical protein